ncbi:MAG: CHAT domain-containing protein [Oscillatoria princeps RMCB-10]|nr:CHAT domain-containing protein [Oscillatoria princeps RMCB-10]
MPKKQTGLFSKLPAFLNVGRRLHRRLVFPLLALLTALLCLTGLPVLAKAHSSNSTDTYAQVDGGEVIAGNLLKQAQDQEASGLYRRACGTLLQALELSNLDCKTLTRDEMEEEDKQQLEDLLQKLPATPLRATGLTSLGNVLRMLGAVKTSEVVLNRSLDLGMRAGADISAAYLGLGNTKRALGKRAEYLNDENGQQRYREALDDYEKAIATSVSDASTVRAKLNKLSLLVEIGYSEDIADLWRDVKGQVEKLPVAPESVYARIDLAQSLACLKVREMGEEERKQVPSPEPPIFRLCTPNKNVETRKFASLQAVPEWKDAGQLLAAAAQQAETLKEVRSQSYALGTLGELYELTQQWPDAKNFSEEGLRLAQSIQAWDVAYRLQWQLGRLRVKQKTNREEALQFYTVAFNNLQNLRRDLTASNRDVQFSFREEIEPLYRELVDLLLQPAQPSQNNLQFARQVIEGLQLAEIDDFFKDACSDANPEQIDNVLDESDSTAAALYTIILDKKLAVIVKLPKQKELHYYSTDFPQGKGYVENRLTQLQAYLQTGHASPEAKPLSEEVYDWLIRRPENELNFKGRGIKTLVFILDGSLRNIPMAALSDGKEYLLQKYGVALTPGLQLLSPRPLARENLKVLGAGVSEKQTIDDKFYPPIDSVKQELEGVNKIVRSKIILNQDFSKENLQKQLSSETFSIVHIATHGEFSSDPGKTYLIAWEKRLKVADLDNILRIKERTGSEKRDIELLILTACNTAKGDTRSALGIAGVAVRAGARSTLASLWRADDQYSVSLAEEFYKQLQNNPKISKTEALQQAQLKLFQEESSTPYNWAPYILLGNWQ